MARIITSVKKNKKYKNYKNHQIHRMKQSFKKFGGAINQPYHSMIPPEEDICPDLTDINTKIKKVIETKNTEDIKDLEPHVLQASLPLYNFKQVIYSMCKINDIPIDDSHKVLLVDQYDNYVFSNYTNILDQEIDVHCFKINTFYR